MKRLTLEPKFFKYHLKTGGSDDSNIQDSNPNSETSFLTTSVRHLLGGRSSVMPSDSSIIIEPQPSDALLFPSLSHQHPSALAYIQLRECLHQPLSSMKSRA